MAIKSNYREGDILVNFEAMAEAFVGEFIAAGELFLKDAVGQMQDHAMGTYIDRTTDLRNSIGYRVYRNGELVRSGGSNMNVPGADERINKTGIQLIGFAGMDYASYVESKGYNVISYQADVCVVDLTSRLERLKVLPEGSAANREETFIP